MTLRWRDFRDCMNKAGSELQADSLFKGHAGNCST